MMSIDTLYLALQKAYRSGDAWAAYRTPRADYLSLIQLPVQDLETYTHWDDLGDRSGLMIAPFHLDEAHPIVLFPAQSTRLDLPLSPHLTPNQSVALDTSPSASYRESFGHFAKALNQGDFDKLVLARTLQLDGSHLDPVRTFLLATRLYPDAYTYILYTPQTGLWLGSTPELLISGQGAHWQTMALAGTQPASTSEAPLEWSDKNQQEQAIVTDYICERLGRLGLQPETSVPYTVRAGTLAHLRTDLSFSTPSTLGVGSLIAQLHPTPAICGQPREAAEDFIVRYEPEPRGYYSGCLGQIDREGQTALYVNLRCLSLVGKELKLYAGGGLLATSRLEEEWLETERKLQTMRSALVFDTHPTSPSL